MLELNNRNFFEIVGKEKYVIVKFYTKWCKFCRILSPAYEEFYEEKKLTRKDIIVARIEGDYNEEICYEYGIDAFPKVVLFYPYSIEMKSDFEGKRTLKSLNLWVEEMAPELKNDNQLLKLLGDDLEDDFELLNTNDSRDLSDSYESYELKDIDNSSQNSKETNLDLDNKLSSNNKFEIDSLKSDLKFIGLKYDEVNKEFLELNQIISNKEKLNINNGKLNENSLLSNLDFFRIMVSCLIFLIVIAAYITLRKTYNKLH